MKRFFCTTCKRIKQVRVLPDDVRNVESRIIEDRTGTCRFHGTGRVNPVKGVNHVFRAAAPAPVPVPVARGKRAR